MSSQYGIGSRPVVSRRNAPSAMSSSHTSDVSRSWMKAIERPSAESASDRGRSVAAIASSRQCGGAAGPRRVGVGTPPYSSVPIQTESGSGIPVSSLLEALQRGEHEPADRGEIVATFLYDDASAVHGWRRSAARLAVAGARHLERALGIGGCSVDSERQDDGLGTVVAGRLSELAHRREPARSSRAPGGSGTLRFGSVPAPLSALGGAAEEVREPARRRIDVYGTVKTSSRCQKIDWAPLPWWASMSTTATRAAAEVAQVLRRDRRVVQVAGAAVGGARHVMSGRAAAGVGGRCPGGDEVAGGERRVGRGSGRLQVPGPIGVIVSKQNAPGRAHGGRRHERLDLAHQAGVREDVRDDAVLPGVFGKPAASQSSQACARYSTRPGSCTASSAASAWRRPSPLRLRRPRASSGCVRPARAPRLQGPDADPDLGRRLVQAVVVRPHERDRQRHGGDPTSGR